METLPTGKLKSDFLEKILGKIEIKDKNVIVGPGIGEDAAAIDVGEYYLLLKSDPITFVSDRIGWYVVNINANDIAVMGGSPRYFLVTMLLPEKITTIKIIDDIMHDLRKSCSDLNISLIGGHTEITSGLNKPILIGTMLGEVEKNNLIKNGSIKEGDYLYLTKGIAIEATSVIARDKKDEVINLFGRDFYKKCIDYLIDPGISVLKDAKRALASVKVTGMHDPTEGGVLSGAYEMARSSNIGLNIYIDQIPIFDETKRLCNYFNISPYSSIASGSLLISVSKKHRSVLENTFCDKINGIPYISMIGEFTKKNKEVYIIKDSKKVVIHPTGKDELTKLL